MILKTNKITVAFSLAGALFLSNTVFGAESVKIGVPVGLSGANSVVAPSIVQAAQLAADNINQQGGILGRPVEIIVADDASGAVGAQKAFNSLIFDKQVNAIISAETSAARNAALPIVNRGKVPYIYASFYEGHSCNPWLFVNGWVPEQLTSAIVNYLKDDRKANSFFLIGSDYAFGRGVLTYTRQYILDHGGKVVGEEYLPMDGSDWSAIISKLRAAHPDALISCTAGGAPNVSLGKQLKSSGVNLPYANMALDEGTAKEMGSAADGIIIAGSYMTNLDTPENHNFLQRMQSKFGKDLKTPNDLSVPVYDAFLAYKAAAEKSRSLEGRDIIKALGEVEVLTPRGLIHMDASNRHAPLNMYLAEVQSDGSVKVIKSFKNVLPGQQCKF